MTAHANTPSAPPPVVGACKHHWVIEAPSGPTSRGVCRNCRTEKQFKNFIDSAPWGEDHSNDSKRYPAAKAAPAAAPSNEEEEAA